MRGKFHEKCETIFSNLKLHQVIIKPGRIFIKFFALAAYRCRNVELCDLNCVEIQFMTHTYAPLAPVTYTSLKVINKYKLKFKSKPWITLGLQKSISVKNKLVANFISKGYLIYFSFFPCTARLQNSPPIKWFPLTYDLMALILELTDIFYL